MPEAVIEELHVGIAHGIDLPNLSVLPWIEVSNPSLTPALLDAAELGSGERALALAIEQSGTPVILDDRPARRVAQRLGIRLSGTLGLLLDAKQAGIVDEVAPFLDRLQALRFRLDAATRTHVLDLAGERTT